MDGITLFSSGKFGNIPFLNLPNIAVKLSFQLSEIGFREADTAGLIEVGNNPPKGYFGE